MVRKVSVCGSRTLNTAEVKNPDSKESGFLYIVFWIRSGNRIFSAHAVRERPADTAGVLSSWKCFFKEVYYDRYRMQKKSLEMLAVQAECNELPIF